MGKRFILAVSALFWIYGAILFLALLPAPDAMAHPHVFITQRLNVFFDEQGLAGIRVRWDFDDMFAAMIAEDHDLNRNGALEDNEVREIKDKAFAFIAEYNYFTFIRIEGQPLVVKEVTDFTASLKDHRLAYEFTVPCRVQATSQFKKVSVASYDPTYYTAIMFVDKQPVTVKAAEIFEVKTAVREDPDTKIYYDMIHPWTLFLEFREKP